MWQKW